MALRTNSEKLRGRLARPCIEGKQRDLNTGYCRKVKNAVRRKTKSKMKSKLKSRSRSYTVRAVPDTYKRNSKGRVILGVQPAKPSSNALDKCLASRDRLNKKVVRLVAKIEAGKLKEQARADSLTLFHQSVSKRSHSHRKKSSHSKSKHRKSKSKSKKRGSKARMDLVDEWVDDSGVLVRTIPDNEHGEKILDKLYDDFLEHLLVKYPEEKGPAKKGKAKRKSGNTAPLISDKAIEAVVTNAEKSLQQTQVARRKSITLAEKVANAVVLAPNLIKRKNPT